jgi:hypothetical protein
LNVRRRVAILVTGLVVLSGVMFVRRCSNATSGGAHVLATAPPAPPAAPLPPPPDCDALRASYRAALEPTDSCKTDDECIAERRDGVVSGLDGCMRFRRRDAELSELARFEQAWVRAGCAKTFITCGERRAQCLAGRCAERPPDGLPRSSRRVDANGKFSFVVPPDVVQKEAQGEDSYVGLFEGPRYTLTFDYGEYGTALDGEDVKVLRREKTIISGVEAMLIASRNRDGLVYSGVHFANIPAVGRGNGLRLTLWATCKKLDDCADVPIIARSIELH